ncbi:MAG: NADP oxidoreductase [Omnitrophica WOR_2 bacterium RIFCSPHIGHO2_01_FULL_48_9]|nr:MAG: NADP oxidoreductase [Omnitrophica WOR_2 bacterium RIFCSPHIGHO2_02_FULL_48_11]OGX33196.1 MAG: NADP oxidoreductase [Omnitrophica WOR_2 bacterium RIFCSPHIGHO2_01_FULL_48_9]
MSNLGLPERPLRVAVIGSGPSGFYAAEELLLGKVKAKVDMFDRLPAPFGLVRYGVAPDHPKIKNVIKVFEKTAVHPDFSFFGNVKVGQDISFADLRDFYDAVIFTCGAQTDNKLGIPGEDLAGSYTATEFVAWYNGHPDYRNRTFDLSCEVAVVVGQGNVAMDVSRILCKNPEELKTTDIAQHALEVLAKSKVKEVHLIGRRGPAQAAFTPPELKEFGELPDCDPLVNAADLNVNPESQEELDNPNNAPKKKNFEIMKEYSGRPASGKSKKFVIHFCKSPKELKGNGHIEELILEKNKLSGPAGKQKAEGTGILEEIPCGILFRSVGYRGVPIPGVPFEEKRGVFPNLGGRITEGGQVVLGLYAAGWIKRGPSGVIGTNKPDSAETVNNLLADIPSLKPCTKPDSQAVLALLKGKGVKVVSFDDWKKIDAAEIANGQKNGKLREKFVKVEEMLAVLK